MSGNRCQQNLPRITAIFYFAFYVSIYEQGEGDMICQGVFLFYADSDSIQNHSKAKVWPIVLRCIHGKGKRSPPDPGMFR